MLHADLRRDILEQPSEEGGKLYFFLLEHLYAFDFAFGVLYAHVDGAAFGVEEGDYCFQQRFH